MLPGLLLIQACNITRQSMTGTPAVPMATLSPPTLVQNICSWTTRLVTLHRSIFCSFATIDSRSLTCGAVRTYCPSLDHGVWKSPSLMAQFPSAEIAERSFLYRTLGLGYANIGGLLMTSGIPYDSDEGRAICGAISALMTGVLPMQLRLKWPRSWVLLSGMRTMPSICSV